MRSWIAAISVDALLLLKEKGGQRSMHTHNSARLIVCLILLFLLLNRTVGTQAADVAQSQRAQNQSAPRSAGAAYDNESPRTQQLTEQIAVLKAQNDLVKSFDERLVSTVYWALSTVGGIALLLVGYSWFTNIRMAEREKRAIAEELTTLVRERLATLTEHVGKQISDSEQRLNRRIDQQVGETIAPIAMQIQAMQGQITEMQIDATIRTADMWEDRNVSSNALSYFLYAAKDAQRYKKTTQFEVALNGIDRVVKGGLPRPVGQAFLTDLLKFLTTVPPSYTALANNITENLKKYL